MSVVQHAIQASLIGLFKGFASVRKECESYQPLVKEIALILASDQGFTEKYSAVDAIINQNPQFEDLREALFDLVMIRFLSIDADRFNPDYFESDEWLDLEEETIDRGTELLNILLYIDECHHDGIEVGLEDFLDEFLMTQEEGFHEEHEIYASLIEFQEMTDEDIIDIVKVSESLDEGDPMHEYLLPVILFFKGNVRSEDVLPFLDGSDLHALQMAYLCSLQEYHHNLISQQ